MPKKRKKKHKKKTSKTALLLTGFARNSHVKFSHKLPQNIQSILIQYYIIKNDSWYINNTPLQRLLLSNDQMIYYKYPQSNWIYTNSEFIYTPKYDKNIKKYQILGIDCEMVITVKGYELARVSMVDINLNVVYDAYVKPKHKIKDYLTEFSGITVDIMRECNKTLNIARQEMFKLIDCNTILVGHALENDLKALRLIHYNIIDTSVLFVKWDHQKKYEYKVSLKNLADICLKRNIQNNKIIGHSSIEDSQAAMELMLIKLNDEIMINKQLNLNVTSIPKYTNQTN